MEENKVDLLVWKLASVLCDPKLNNAYVCTSFELIGLRIQNVFTFCPITRNYTERFIWILNTKLHDKFIGSSRTPSTPFSSCMHIQMIWNLKTSYHTPKIWEQELVGPRIQVNSLSMIHCIQLWLLTYYLFIFQHYNFVILHFNY